MFTGLVEAIGVVRAVGGTAAGRRLEIDLGPVVAEGARRDGAVGVQATVDQGADRHAGREETSSPGVPELAADRLDLLIRQERLKGGHLSRRRFLGIVLIGRMERWKGDV